MVNSLSSWAVICGLALFGAAAQQPAPPQGQQPPPAQAPRPEPTLKAGDRAPAFELQGSDGKVHRLSDYKGKTVVLAWFPKAFTGG
jgi:cytochrome oxidase Cu insertion factor (SCO1/SenC/PrrC family)